MLKHSWSLLWNITHWILQRLCYNVILRDNLIWIHIHSQSFTENRVHCINGTLTYALMHHILIGSNNIRLQFDYLLIDLAWKAMSHYIFDAWNRPLYRFNFILLYRIMILRAFVKVEKWQVHVILMHIFAMLVYQINQLGNVRAFMQFIAQEFKYESEDLNHLLVVCGTKH